MKLSDLNINRVRKF